MSFAAPMRGHQMPLLAVLFDSTLEKHNGEKQMIFCDLSGSTSSSKHAVEVAKLMLVKWQNSS
jgi:hypothetical protein